MSHKETQVDENDEDLQNQSEDSVVEPNDKIEELIVDEDTDVENQSDEQVLETLRNENLQLLDKYARAKAETDNTRRISAKEVEKARKFALEAFCKELLPVKDSLNQASQFDLQGEVDETLMMQMQEGLALTLKQLDSAFERFNVETVAPEAGDKLDPELHQAMTRQPNAEVDANNIVATIQTGYTLNGRLLRPAMVIVSSGNE